MPQKQPPATTAVCSPLGVEIAISTAGFGTAATGLSPALQAIAPATVSIKTTADMREKLVITNSSRPSLLIIRAQPLRLAKPTKVTNMRTQRRMAELLVRSRIQQRRLA